MSQRLTHSHYLIYLTLHLKMRTEESSEAPQGSSPYHFNESCHLDFPSVAFQHLPPATCTSLTQPATPPIPPTSQTNRSHRFQLFPSPKPINRPTSQTIEDICLTPARAAGDLISKSWYSFNFRAIRELVQAVRRRTELARWGDLPGGGLV